MVLLRPFTKTRPTPETVAFWQALHRLADAEVLPLRARVLAVLQALSTQVPLPPFRQALAAEDLAAAEAILLHTLDQAAPQWAEAFAPLPETVGAPVAALTTEVTLGLTLEVAPDVLTLLAQSAGARIVQISETTREAIRGILVRGAQSGMPLQAQVKEMASQVGLTDRMAQTVTRYREGLVEVGTAAPRIETLVQQRIAALKQQRALTVARTETLSVANRAAQLTMEEHVVAGRVVAGEVRRYWMTAEDDALCPFCAPIPSLNADGRGLLEPFTTPLGPALVPTLHPNCRCNVNYVIG